MGGLEMRRRKFPPHVEVMRDRHGKLRTYFRKVRGAPVIALPMIGTPAFGAAYHEALTGCALPTSATRPCVAGTIEALIRSYKASGEFRSLRAVTKAQYNYRLDTLRLEHGQRTVSGLTKERIEKLLVRF